MTDTARTKAAIIALMPDNTTGMISPQDMRDFVESVGNPVVGGGFERPPGATGATGPQGPAGGPMPSFYNALDYGSSMNAARVQAAVDACIATTRGGVVLLPASAGTYAFGSSSVSVDWNNSTDASKVSIWGVGSDSTVISKTGAGPAIFFGTTQAGLSAPKNMSELRGFRVTGPGKSTSGSIGITIKEASYFHLWDVRVDDCETGLLIDSGTSFSTGGNFHGCRTSNCKFGYVITDTTASGLAENVRGEGTDHHFWGCYHNGGYTSLSGAAGSIGFYLRRANTCNFYGCSVEATEVGFQLGNSDGAAGWGQALRNGFYYCRYEIAGTTPAATWAEAFIIYDGPIPSNDNAFFGTKGTVRDYSADQANVIIGKRDTNRTGTLNTEHRLVRVLDSVWDSTGSMTNGSAVLTTTNGVFQANDVGRNIWVDDALSGPADLATTIITYTSPTQVTLNANATRTTGAGARFLVQATLPTANQAANGKLLHQERMGSDDRLVFYYTDSGDTARRAPVSLGATF